MLSILTAHIEHIFSIIFHAKFRSCHGLLAKSVGQENREQTTDSWQSCLVVQAKFRPHLQESQTLLGGRRCSGESAG